ncbi:uncharacterized protein CPUR_01483 [Claviceps purpurea 20.1]|uniref:CCHC-type domain-containing protein n=1 Tax=Claviceps purpurea (strain 20.1) TaxID=1111077 RepID=M1WB27_CLAP2|nr:uncharacterized protein CPUR_01483 [Claviceps purpurea 20.1]
MFNPSQGDDIKKFISNVNGLADQARILQSERKSILQERVPASMGPNLLTLSKDDDVSYEKLCQHVADAAYTRQRAFQLGGLRASCSRSRTCGHDDSNGKEWVKRLDDLAALQCQVTMAEKAAHRDDRPARRKSSSRQPTVKKEARVKETYRSGHREAEGADRARSDKRETRTCFLCKKKGHIALDCPNRRDIARICKELDDEEVQAATTRMSPIPAPAPAPTRSREKSRTAGSLYDGPRSSDAS